MYGIKWKPQWIDSLQAHGSVAVQVASSSEFKCGGTNLPRMATLSTAVSVRACVRRARGASQRSSTVTARSLAVLAGCTVSSWRAVRFFLTCEKQQAAAGVPRGERAPVSQQGERDGLTMAWQGLCLTECEG
jgi:hypothetical protein